jgi:hypothetical protein
VAAAADTVATCRWPLAALLRELLLHLLLTLLSFHANPIAAVRCEMRAWSAEHGVREDLSSIHPRMRKRAAAVAMACALCIALAAILLFCVWFALCLSAKVRATSDRGTKQASERVHSERLQHSDYRAR